MRVTASVRENAAILEANGDAWHTLRDSESRNRFYRLISREFNVPVEHIRDPWTHIKDDNLRRKVTNALDNAYDAMYTPKEIRLAGWKFMGSGISRDAWLNRKDGLVYKFARHGRHDNERDAKWSRELRALPLPEDFVVPAMRVVTNRVLVCEAMIPDKAPSVRRTQYNWDGSDPCSAAVARFEKFCEDHGISAGDNHYHNVYLSGGKWTVVDFGNYYRSEDF